MEASFEPLGHAGVARVHPAGGFGTPYTWACAVEINGDTAILKGVSRRPTASEARALREMLRSMGIAHITWERANVPLARKTTIELRPDRGGET